MANVSSIVDGTVVGAYRYFGYKERLQLLINNRLYHLVGVSDIKTNQNPKLNTPAQFVGDHPCARLGLRSQ